MQAKRKFAHIPTFPTCYYYYFTSCDGELERRKAGDEKHIDARACAADCGHRLQTKCVHVGVNWVQCLCVWPPWSMNVHIVNFCERWFQINCCKSRLLLLSWVFWISLGPWTVTVSKESWNNYLKQAFQQRHESRTTKRRKHRQWSENRSDLRCPLGLSAAWRRRTVGGSLHARAAVRSCPSSWCTSLARSSEPVQFWKRFQYTYFLISLVLLFLKYVCVYLCLFASYVHMWACACA